MSLALNGLFKIYLHEGQYDPIHSDLRVLDAVSVFKVNPHTFHVKYKIGKHMRPE